MFPIIKYSLYDITRNRVIIGYTLFLLCMSFGLYTLESQPEKATLSLLNILLILIPLVSIVFSTIHYYNSYEFTELLLAQPLPRRSILLSQYISIAIALTLAYLIGIVLPVLLNDASAQGYWLLLTGFLLNLVFVSMAFLSAVSTRDKARGIGLALLIWFYFALLYDGIILFILFTFSDYPLEKAVVALSMLNPVDMGRIAVIMKMETAALMGYTGAVFQDFMGTTKGLLISLAVIILWIIIPLGITLKIFKHKDL
jgi:Cu-processing system permease protein